MSTFELQNLVKQDMQADYTPELFKKTLAWLEEMEYVSVKEKDGVTMLHYIP